MTAAIKIQNLTVSFDEHKIFNDAHITIPAKKITMLVGPSGGGKTTLLRAMNRLFSGGLISGSIWVHLDHRWVDVNGKDLDPTWLRRRMGMVLQVPRALPRAVN